MKQDRLLFLLPVFNDWESAAALLPKIEAVLQRAGRRAAVLLINDGSTSSEDGMLGFGLESDSPSNRSNRPQAFQCIDAVDVLHLKRNIGHQRAICIGLSFVDAEGKTPGDAIIVMDSDGEDDPEDVPRLLAEFDKRNGTHVIFAERTKRSESMLFRVLYRCYRLLHLTLVGHRVRVGNFSILPASMLPGLTLVPELWNHYAAAVFTAKLQRCAVPTRRAKRLDGSSKMDFVSLVVHGLSAISAFSDRIGVRMLAVIVPLIIAVLTAIGTVVGIRLWTELVVPAWATYGAGLLLVLLLQLLVLAVVFCFVILHGRANSTFLPARDYSHFVDRSQSVYSTKANRE